MASLPTKPTIMAKEEKEEEKKDKKEEELEQKLRANPMDGALVVVEPMKKGGNCGMIGPGLLDVFLRLGFLKVVSAVLNILMSRISHSTSLLLRKKKFLVTELSQGNLTLLCANSVSNQAMKL